MTDGGGRGAGVEAEGRGVALQARSRKLMFIHRDIFILLIIIRFILGSVLQLHCFMHIFGTSYRWLPHKTTSVANIPMTFPHKNRGLLYIYISKSKIQLF